MGADYFEKLGALIAGRHKAQVARIRERGNVFFTLFGAVAVVGVLGAGIMSTMRGPLTTMVEVNRIEETKAEMGISLRLILLKGSEQDGSGTPDVLTEPKAPTACTSATNAGCIPNDTSAKQKDAWGTSYAYCAWNNGSDDAAIGTILGGDVSTNNIAVALISAGPDRVFQTSCQTNPGSGGGFQVISPADGGGDDIVRKYNYNDAAAGSDGLWALQAGASGDEARVEEEINVGGGAGSVSTFEGGARFNENIQTEGNVNTDVIGPVPSGTQDYVEFTNGILLGDTATCTDGMLRINANKLQLCLGGAWDEVGKALWIEDANGMRNDDTLAPNVGIGVGSSSAYKLFVNGGTATDTLKATSTVDFDTTLNVDGAADLNSTLDVTGATTLGATLGVVGAAELDGTLGVDGTSEFREDATFIADVFIEKTAGGIKGNLSVQDKITASEGNITATAGNVVATAGDVIATAGDVTATAGNVTAGDSITAQNNITATTGNIAATAGNVEATAGNIIALGAGGKIVGKSFHRGSDGALDFSDIDACDPETEKTVWSAVSGWGCEPDNGTGTGTAGESTLEDVLGRGNDAAGQDAEDFGKIGADEYCDAGLTSCVTTANLIAGSSIWKNDGPEGAAGEIYYNGGKVGIGTNDPVSRLHIGATGIGTGVPAVTIVADGVNDGGTALQVQSAPQAGASSFAAHKSDSSIVFWVSEEGRVAVGPQIAATALDVGGTLKIGDGTELCNSVDHEGALKYDAAGDKFYMCRNSVTGWEELGTGSGTDTLAGLSCTDGQVAAWDDGAGEWACAANGSGGGAVGPSFSVNKGGTNQAVTAATSTKVTWSTELFDTNNNFASDRFTPTAAGKYIFSGSTTCGFITGYCLAILYRNGLVVAEGGRNSSASGSDKAATVTHILDMNGTTDYAELYVYTSGTTVAGAVGQTYFTGSMLGGGSGGDTLAGLSCTSGQVAAWNGTVWACSTPSGGGGASVYFEATRDVTQSIASGAWTTLAATNQVQDVGGDNFNATTGVFTAPSNGFYQFNASAYGSWIATTTVSGIYIITSTGKTVCNGSNTQNTSANLYANISCSGSVYLTAGLTVYPQVYQNSGAAKNFGGSFDGFLVGGGSGGSDTLAGLSCTDGQVAAWNNTGGVWECTDAGAGIWSDSGNGYIEYSVAEAGVKLANVTGMAQPVLGLAAGMTWDAGASSLNITGNITYSGTLTDTSDRRLKSDIEDLVHYGSMLDRINAIDTYSFRMKDTPDAPKEFGVMAQELEGIFPELVHTAHDEMRTKSVNYVGLIAPMIEAMKELEAENAALRTASEGKFKALEDQVALLSKIAGNDAQRASSAWLWLMMALWGGMGVAFVVIARPASLGGRGRQDR